MIYANDKTLLTNVVPFVPSSAKIFSSVFPDGGVQITLALRCSSVNDFFEHFMLFTKYSRLRVLIFLVWVDKSPK